MLKNMLTILVLLYSTKLFSGGYPFQEPYRFTPAWVHSRYYLAGDIAIYSKQNVTYQTMSPLIPSTIKNRPTEFVANKKYSLLNGPFSKGLDGSRKCNNYKLPNPFNIGTTIIFTPNNEKFPTAVITRQGDLISMYVGHPQQEANGSKLTFNIDSFEKYMKTTSWYDSLDYQTGGKTKIDRVMSFGFAFNADKSNFEILNQNKLQPDTSVY